MVDLLEHLLTSNGVLVGLFLLLVTLIVYRGMTQVKIEEEKPTQQGLVIRFDHGNGVKSMTYHVSPGDNIWRHPQTRGFLKWYFGRPESESFFIWGSAGDGIEWRRKNIINVEIWRDIERRGTKEEKV